MPIQLIRIFKETIEMVVEPIHFKISNMLHILHVYIIIIYIYIYIQNGNLPKIGVNIWKKWKYTT